MERTWSLRVQIHAPDVKQCKSSKKFHSNLSAVHRTLSQRALAGLRWALMLILLSSGFHFETLPWIPFLLFLMVESWTPTLSGIFCDVVYALLEEFWSADHVWEDSALFQGSPFGDNCSHSGLLKPFFLIASGIYFDHGSVLKVEKMLPMSRCLEV